MKNLMNCSIFHCSAILKFHIKIAHSLLSNGRFSDWAVSMVIWTSTKIKHLLFFTPSPSIKFRHNPFITFWVILPTDRLANKRYRNHNLLGWDKSKTFFFSFHISSFWDRMVTDNQTVKNKTKTSHITLRQPIDSLRKKTHTIISLKP